MQVDFSTQMVDIEGEPMEESKLKADGSPVMDGDKPVMLKLSVARVAKRVLLAGFDDEKGLSGEDKLARWTLAQRINKGTKNYHAEDIALVKRLIAKAYTAAVVGPAYAILEGDETDEK